MKLVFLILGILFTLPALAWLADQYLFFFNQQALFMSEYGLEKTLFAGSCLLFALLFFAAYFFAKNRSQSTF
jgi:hypothetical protein